MRGAVVFSCAAIFEGRDCGGEAGDVGLRVDGCAVLGAGGGVGGGISFVGDDSLRDGMSGAARKNQTSMKFFRPGKLGRSVLRPYTSGCAINGGKTQWPDGASPAPKKAL
jgi:hypothetical protein